MLSGVRYSSELGPKYLCVYYLKMTRFKAVSLEYHAAKSG